MVYYGMVASSFFYIIENVLLLALVYEDASGWKLRFSRIQNYPNLRPIQATWKIALIIFSVSLLLIPLAEFSFSDSLISYAKTLQYGFFGLFSLLTGAFFLAWHYIVGKDWNRSQILLVVLQFLFFAILIYLNYFV